MSEEVYYSDCCWACVERAEWLPETGEVITGKCTGCGAMSGKLLTQEMINREIKAYLKLGVIGKLF